MTPAEQLEEFRKPWIWAMLRDGGKLRDRRVPQGRARVIGRDHTTDDEPYWMPRSRGEHARYPVVQTYGFVGEAVPTTSDFEVVDVARHTLCPSVMAAPVDYYLQFGGDSMLGPLLNDLHGVAYKHATI